MCDIPRLAILALSDARIHLLYSNKDVFCKMLR